jgi:NAD(P)-dependent dehydrogenase (short-subunit alcohol dehydrogenase family)
MFNKVLIVGGTSGLGLELAKRCHRLGHTVYIAGRHDPNIQGLKYFNLKIDHETNRFSKQIDNIVANINDLDTFVYSAGFYQEGQIHQLKDEQILEMIHVGLTVPALFIQRLKYHSINPLNILFITSSSQYTPRELEPMYTAVKAGLGMLGRSLVLDKDLGKVIVVAPSGMKSSFWDKNKDVSKYLDPEWVAEQIIILSEGAFKYKYAKILRDPQHVEVVETF